jgi:hypothetical protein
MNGKELRRCHWGHPTMMVKEASAQPMVMGPWILTGRSRFGMIIAFLFSSFRGLAHFHVIMTLSALPADLAELYQKE